MVRLQMYDHHLSSQFRCRVLPAGSPGSEQESLPVLIESHRDPGHVPHPPRLAVPGGARVEPAPVLDTSRAGQAPGQTGQLSLVELLHYCALIGRELQ